MTVEMSAAASFNLFNNHSMGDNVRRRNSRQPLDAAQQSTEK